MFTTNQQIGVVHGTAVAAQLPRGISASDASVHLTKDGHFIYSVDATAINAINTTTLQHSTIPCAAPCPTLALGGSLVGRFNAGGASTNPSGTTDVATVEALDLASPTHDLVTLGQVHLADPHPAQTKVQAYSYFLDAQDGKYLFFDFAPGASANPRPWEQPQILHLATLNGPTVDLGQYSGFGHESDIWGSLSPDAKHAVLNSDSALTGASANCDYSPIDLIDTASGQKTQIHPTPPSDGPQSLRIGRAWWGTDNTLYANYQQWSCTNAIQQPAPPAPTVWSYRDGNWSAIKPLGPALYALPLANNAWVVVKPDTTAAADPTAPARGPLIRISEDGASSPITNDVTAIMPIAPSGPSD